MNRKSVLILAIVVIGAILVTTNISAEEISTTDHDIKINAENEYLKIIETLSLEGNSSQKYAKLAFFIPSGAQEIETLFNNNPNNNYEQNNGQYTYNISDMNLSADNALQVSITYKLGKNTTDFKKIISRQTNTLSVTFNENEIYSADNLAQGSSFSLKLYTPTERPLSWYVVALILLLAILLIVALAYTFKKQKSTKIASSKVESKELLSTKKTLLMSVLKEIEKQHRAKQISDETYYKLKEQYKQQTVDAMKKLEDIESKVK